MEAICRRPGVAKGGKRLPDPLTVVVLLLHIARDPLWLAAVGGVWAFPFYKRKRAARLSGCREESTQEEDGSATSGMAI